MQREFIEDQIKVHCLAIVPSDVISVCRAMNWRNRSGLVSLIND